MPTTRSNKSLWEQQLKDQYSSDIEKQALLSNSDYEYISVSSIEPISMSPANNSTLSLPPLENPENPSVNDENGSSTSQNPENPSANDGNDSSTSQDPGDFSRSRVKVTVAKYIHLFLLVFPVIVISFIIASDKTTICQNKIGKSMALATVWGWAAVVGGEAIVGVCNHKDIFKDQEVRQVAMKVIALLWSYIIGCMILQVLNVY